MPDYKLHFQLHYMQRMAQRGFTDEQVKLVVNGPEHKIAQGAGERGGTVYRMQKIVDRKKLLVVAEIIKNDAYLTTAFFKDE